MTAWGKSGLTGWDVPPKRKISLHKVEKLLTVLEVETQNKKNMDPTSQSHEPRNVENEALFFKKGYIGLDVL